MLTKRKWPRKAFSAIFVAACLLLSGCQPSGPKSLLKGQEYIREGQYEKALAVLKDAAELMPSHPQVWNHLGLAYHGLGQSGKAVQSYQQALQINRNLAPVRFNLGMLYLEENQLPQAIAEFSSFTVLQPNEPAGWKGLGTALLRAQKVDEAERALDRASRLAPKDPEIFNNLGLVHLQRKRPREAVQAFNAALQAQPGYPPALLNQAIVAEQYFGNKQAALERYRAYLSTKPPTLAARQIQGIIAALERELNPPEVAAAPSITTNQPASPPPATPVASVAPIEEKPPMSPDTNALAAASTNAPPSIRRTNVVQAPPAVSRESTNRMAVAPKEPPTKTNVIAAPATNAPHVEPKPEPVAVEVVQLTSEPRFKIPVDAAPPPPRTNAPPATNQLAATNQQDSTAAERLVFVRRPPEPEKPSIMDRLNPLGWFRKDDEKESRVPPPSVRIPESYSARKRGSDGIDTVPLAPPRNFPRYPFRTPSAPSKGNREQAQVLFQEGARAHAAQRTSDAIEAYRKAIAADPSFFEAYYNLGVAAYEAKNLPLALGVSEQAVALDPASLSARFNFAITLRDANYPVDAANQLRELLVEAPDETRAHFALANLYAQQLNEPILARRHYHRVIELEPTHPQAAIIREWLANQ